MSLAEFANEQPQRKQGFPGVMDRISPEDFAEALAGWQSGITAPTIRAWLQQKYPDIRFTSSNVDLFFSKNYARNRRIRNVDDGSQVADNG